MLMENKFQVRTIVPRTRRENPFELFVCKFCNEWFRGNLDYQTIFGLEGVRGVCEYCEKVKSLNSRVKQLHAYMHSKRIFNF